MWVRKLPSVVGIETQSRFGLSFPHHSVMRQKDLRLLLLLSPVTRRSFSTKSKEEPAGKWQNPPIELPPVSEGFDSRALCKQLQAASNVEGVLTLIKAHSLDMSLRNCWTALRELRAQRDKQSPEATHSQRNSTAFQLRQDERFHLVLDRVSDILRFNRTQISDVELVQVCAELNNLSVTRQGFWLNVIRPCLELYVPYLESPDLATVARVLAWRLQQGKPLSKWKQLIKILETRTIELLPSCSPTEVTSLAFSFSTFAKLGAHVDLLWPALANNLIPRFGEFSAGQITNILQSFVRVGGVLVKKPQPFDVKAFCSQIETRVLSDLSSYSSQQLAVVSHGMARLGGRSFRKFIFTAAKQIQETTDKTPVTTKGLLGAFWALLYVDIEKKQRDLAEGFLKHIRATMEKNGGSLASLSCQELGQLALCLGKFSAMSAPPENLVNAIKQQASAVAMQCSPRDLINLLFLYEQVGIRDSAALSALCVPIRSRLLGFYKHEVAHVGWVLARLGHKDEIVFQGVATETLCLIPNMTAEEMAKVSWSFGETGFLHAELMEALLKFGSPKLHSFGQLQLYKYVSGFAQLGLRKPDFFKRAGDWAARSVDRSLCEESGTGLVYSFAQLGLQHPALFDKVADATPAFLPRMDLTQLSRLVWAFGTLQYSPPSQAPLLVGRASEVMPTSLAKVSSATLEHLVGLGFGFAAMDAKGVVQASEDGQLEVGFADKFLVALADRFPSDRVKEMSAESQVELHQLLAWLNSRGRLSEDGLEIKVFGKGEERMLADGGPPSLTFKRKCRRVLRDMARELELTQQLVEDFTDPVSGYSVEAALKEKKMVVVLSGAQAYVFNSPTLLGRYVLLQATLNKQGLTVLHLGHYDHHDLIHEKEQLLYIDQQLKSIYANTVWAQSE
eukprot:g34720.t1